MKADKTPGQKAARKLLDRDYEAFTRFKRKLEAEEQGVLDAAQEKKKTVAQERKEEVAQPLSSLPGTHSAPPEALDEGTEKAVKLFEKLLKQLTSGL